MIAFLLITMIPSCTEYISKSPSALLMLSIPIRQLDPILAFWSMIALLMIVALPIPMLGIPFFAFVAFSSSLSYLEAPMQYTPSRDAPASMNVLTPTIELTIVALVMMEPSEARAFESEQKLAFVAGRC